MVSQTMAKSICRELKQYAQYEVSKYGYAEYDIMATPSNTLVITNTINRDKLLFNGWELYNSIQFENGEKITIKNLMEELF